MRTPACGIRKALPECLPSYEYYVREKLLTVSAATIDRVLNAYKAKHKRKGGTKPVTLLRTEIPVRMGLWDCKRPGFIEADTVQEAQIARPSRNG